MNVRVIKSVVAMGLFAAALTALGVRQYHNLLDPADPLSGNWGMADFRDVVYYPTVALLDGKNPYDARVYMTEYPVGNVFPLYTPHLLLLFLPFGLLPFAISGVLFWLLLVSTYPVFAAVCLKVCGARPQLHRVFFLATVILVSVPGRWAFDAGQLAVLWSIGTVVAMQYAATRPGLAGLGLMIAACKPTFGVPLALLFICQRRLRTVLVGSGLAAVASALVLGIIAAGSGWGSVWNMLDENQSVLEAARAFDPGTSHTRVDANVFVQQVLGLPGGRLSEIIVFAAVMLPAAVALLGRTAVPPASAAGALMLLAVVVCVYHQTYDAVVLTPVPLAAVVAMRKYWTGLPRWSALAAPLLCAVPLFNVLWTKTFGAVLRRGLHVSEAFLEAFAGVAAVINSTACLLAFVVVAAVLLAKSNAPAIEHAAGALRAEQP